MPAGIGASDRKLLLIGGGLLVLMLTASVVLAPPSDELKSPVPSTYSAQSSGAKAAYVLLSELHYSVRRWESSPTELRVNPKNSLLILAEPFQPPSEKEREALADFVREGGHLLFTGSSIRMFFSDASVSNSPADPAWTNFSPSIPGRFAVAAHQVTIQPEVYWGALDSSQLVLYGEPDAAVVVSWKLGLGEILWWAGSTPFTNAGITKGDNLAFFLDALKNWSSGKNYEIYWDEYFHGQRSSLWSYVAKTSLVWGLLQIGVIAFALLFTFSRRSGPIYIPAEVSRLSPLEYVETLGGLYERAGAASSAVAISYQRFRSLLTRQLSLPSNTTDRELGQAAEVRLGWRESGMTDLLQQAANATHVGKLPTREALDLVKKLEQHAAKLTIRPAIRKEKI